MIKSIIGNSLSELDKTVNKFCKEHLGAKVINFAVEHTGHVGSKYIYIIEYQEFGDKK